MGFLSWRRASTLYKLQKAIVPPHQSLDENMSSLRCSLASGARTETGRALERYFDLCESDSEVKQVMEREDLVRFDLRGVLMRLTQRGLGEWINNHYAALSTIAHAMPLQYFVHSEREGVRAEEVYTKLVTYWQGKMSGQQLLNPLPPPHVFALYEVGREQPAEIIGPWQLSGSMWRHRRR